MNQEMIGTFIAKCRKEKGLTQMQLAEKNFLELFNNNKGKKNLTIMQLVGDVLFVCGLTFLLTFPSILQLSGTHEVIMRAMGAFVMVCGFVINILARGIKHDLTI